MRKTSVVHSAQQAATYYFAYNAQGDVIGIYDASGTVVATYAYDEWGNCTVQVLAADSNGHAADSPDHIAQVNPFRYRGYFMIAKQGSITSIPVIMTRRLVDF